MINQDQPLKDFLSVIDFEKNKFHKTKHNLFLTTYEMNILDKYHIRYNNQRNTTRNRTYHIRLRTSTTRRVGSSRNEYCRKRLLSKYKKIIVKQKKI